MITFIRGRYSKNGGEIKHIKNRSVTVFKDQLPDNNNPSVCLQFKRADVNKEMLGVGSSNTIVLKDKAECTSITISREAALALTMLLNDYWERVDKDWLESLKDECEIIVNH